MAKTSMTPKDWIRKGLEEHGQDLLREMVAVFWRARSTALKPATTKI